MVMNRRKKGNSKDSSFLSELVLLRNDPELLDEVIPLAEEGDANAQYALGLIYAEGRGVKIDLARAYMWLSRAVDQGDIDARDLRHVVVEHMTEADMVSAELLLSGQQLH